MSDIFIKKEELIKLLGKAFDKGWSGYYDLKDAVVDEIIEECIKEQIPLKKVEWTPNWTTIADPNIISVGNNIGYSYSSGIISDSSSSISTSSSS